MDKHKVAIILPVCNVMPHIKPMIEALYESTKFPFKLIIVDGFSTDGTEEYCQALANADVMVDRNIEFHQIERKGLPNAINYGIEKAGKLDVYLTQADVIHFKLFGRDWLQDMYDTAKHNKNAGLIIGIGGGGISGPSFLDNFRWAGTWNTYIPRSAINKIGLFDEQFTNGDDIDYSYRVYLAGLDFLSIKYWVQHHELTNRRATHKPSNLINMGKLFKKKYNIK